MTDDFATARIAVLEKQVVYLMQQLSDLKARVDESAGLDFDGRVSHLESTIERLKDVLHEPRGYH